ncbi:MAG TPA: hypothetical protein VHN14_32005 [Kofleriaceae bacterium]|jgi:hypothetical protein|nr:hypothetical protein [Kofleriaceae bacterium]
MRTTIWFVLAAASVPACKWTEFDDLDNQTWVSSTKKPNVKSSDYGVAIQRGDNGTESASGGTLAVIGAGPGTYSELAYSPTGASILKAGSLTLADQGITSLDASPFLLASPESAEIALITTGDPGSIAVATGTHTLKARPLLVNNTSLGSTVTIASTPDAATYMFRGTVAGPPLAEPLVAAGDIVLGVASDLPASAKQPACKLVDDTTPTPIQIRALGAVSHGLTDDVLVWNGGDGKLYLYNGSVFNGCTTQSQSAAADVADVVTPAFMPGHGSQILTISRDRVLLAGHQDIAKGSDSLLQVYQVIYDDAGNLKPMLLPVGYPVTTEGLRTAAVLDTGDATYVIAGYPTAIVDGKTAGQVLVFRISDSGLETTPVATFHDAQPENNQSFGRAVAVMPFQGKQVIAVAADNEIFVYFRAQLGDGTSLYDDTRQGR